MVREPRLGRPGAVGRSSAQAVTIRFIGGSETHRPVWGRCVNATNTRGMALPAVPTALPVHHVVVHQVAHVASTWTTVVDWLGANGLTIALALAGVFATVFVGVAAMIASDARDQERQRPHVDLEHVRYDVKTTASYVGWYGREAIFFFDLVNDGGGPAKEIRLTLVQYGDEKPMIENYLGSISPGQRRACEQPFTLPLRRMFDPDGCSLNPGPYLNTEPFVLIVAYQWVRPGFGEVYIADQFGDKPRPADERPRTTPPRVVPRGPKWMLWMMRRIGMDFT
jgi:hypothetical protein